MIHSIRWLVNVQIEWSLCCSNFFFVCYITLSMIIIITITFGYEYSETLHSYFFEFRIYTKSLLNIFRCSIAMPYLLFILQDTKCFKMIWDQTQQIMCFPYSKMEYRTSHYKYCNNFCVGDIQSSDFPLT